MRSTRRLVPMLCLVLLILGAFALSPVGAGGATSAPFTYTDLTAMGMPATPQEWSPSDHAISIEYRDPSQTMGAPTQMQAQHGPNCEPPPATHPTGLTFTDGIFVCHDHLMTATDSDDSGYSEIDIQPPALLDWSAQQATVDISMSTLRTSLRDWTEFWLTPFGEQSPTPNVNDNPFVDGQGPPRDAIEIEMVTCSGFTCFQGRIYHNYQPTDIGTLDVFDPMEAHVAPSPTVRMPFELDVTSTHVRFGIPSVGWWPVDGAANVGFTQAVYQFAHHSYHPSKEGAGIANTWHWSDLSMTPAIPYTILPATPRFCQDCTLSLAQPAPAGSYLRLRSVPPSVGRPQVSLDGGTTWVTPPTVGEEFEDCCHQQNYWVAIPAGIRSIPVRGMVRDAVVVSLSAPAGSPPTPTPTPTIPPSPSPTATPIPLNNTPCMVTLNGIMVNGTCTGTFTPGG